MGDFKLTEWHCITKIKNYHSRIIAEKVIRNLKNNKETLLSGDDSGLKNLWEEYAVQLQGQESFDFDIYVDTVRNLIEIKLSEQPEAVQKLLEFSKNENSDEDSEFENHQFYYVREFATEEILGDVDIVAMNFENKRIRKYLESDY